MKYQVKMEKVYTSIVYVTSTSHEQALKDAEVKVSLGDIKPEWKERKCYAKDVEESTR